MNTPAQSQKTAVNVPLPDLDRLALALGNNARWRILRELSAGEPRTIAELAKLQREKWGHFLDGRENADSSGGGGKIPNF